MIKNTFPFAFFSGKMIPIENAKISIASNSLQYGTTCFGGIRGYVRDGSIRIFRLEDHYQRLMNSAKILGMNIRDLSYREFHEIINELVEKNRPETDFYVRPFFFTQDEQLAPKPHGMTFELAVYFVPLGQYYDQSKGLRLMVSSWRKFSDDSFPTKAKAGGCYVNSFLATAEALRCGYDEALLMDTSGFIVEASVANILVSYRNRIIMPEIGSPMLEGITMRTVIEFLKEDGIGVHFEKIDRSMMYSCDELVLMGTGAQIAFASSVDGIPIGNKESFGPGSVCRRLREQFTSTLDAEKHVNERRWITEFQRETR